MTDHPDTDTIYRIQRSEYPGLSTKCPRCGLSWVEHPGQTLTRGLFVAGVFPERRLPMVTCGERA